MNLHSPSLGLWSRRYLLIGVLLILATAQVTPKATAVEQTFFSMEFPFERPVALSEAAKRAICTDKGIADVMKNDHLSIESIPDNWFIASEVRLGTKNETDLVVMGLVVSVGPSNAGFWVLRQSSKSYDIVLATHMHDLTLLKSKTNGLRDIEVGESYAAAGERLSTGGHRDSDRYRFDGHQYQRILTVR